MTPDRARVLFRWAEKRKLYSHELEAAWHEENRRRGGNLVTTQDGIALRYEYPNPALQGAAETAGFFRAVRAAMAAMEEE